MLVVDNDPFTLTSLVNALENKQIVVAGRAGTARDALAIADTVSIDVALLDLDLGIGPNGIDLAHALRAKSPEIGLVLLSTYRDPRLMVPDVLSPPRGMAYLSKGDIDNFEQIATRVLSVVTSPLRQRTTNVSKLTGLTASQLKILQLVADGASSQRIADERGVSRKSVEQAISRLSEVLGVAKDGSANQRVRLTRAYLELAGKIDQKAGS